MFFFLFLKILISKQKTKSKMYKNELKSQTPASFTGWPDVHQPPPLNVFSFTAQHCLLKSCSVSSDHCGRTWSPFGLLKHDAYLNLIRYTLLYCLGKCKLLIILTKIKVVTECCSHNTRSILSQLEWTDVHLLWSRTVIQLWVFGQKTRVSCFLDKKEKAHSGRGERRSSQPRKGNQDFGCPRLVTLVQVSFRVFLFRSAACSSRSH